MWLHVIVGFIAHGGNPVKFQLNDLVASKPFAVKNATSIAVGMLAILLSAPAALAHHSFAVFDFQQQIPYEGTVDSVKFRNPHIELMLKVKADDGTDKLVHFIEGAPANMLVRNGIRPEHVAVGQHLKTFGSPLIEDPSKYFLRVIILDDGTEYRN